MSLLGDEGAAEPPPHPRPPNKSVIPTRSEESLEEYFLKESYRDKLK